MTQMSSSYDVVIVGAGLGGLVCGAILAKEGMRVCLLDKNDQIGGSLQTFSFDGHHFDTGVHYIGGLDKGQNLYRYFTYLGIIDRLELQRMDADCFDEIRFKGDDVAYPFAMGYDNFIERLVAHFPKERAGITQYTHWMKQICAQYPVYQVRDAEMTEVPATLTQSAQQYIASCTSDVKLQNVLAGNNLLYAGQADKTPSYTHALVVNSFIESSYRCTQGGDQIAKLLAKQIRAHGGVIHRNTSVCRIVEEAGQITYIETSDGERIYAKHCISNVHPTQTMEMLESTVIRPVYRSRIASLQNTPGAFVLYLTLRENTVLYTNRNTYYHHAADVWHGANCTPDEWPHTYGLFEAVPEQGSRYLAAASVMTYMHWQEVAAWADTSRLSLTGPTRHDGYEQFKLEKSKRLIDSLAIARPDIAHNIKAYCASTPLTYRDYIGTTDGSMYGVANDYQQPARSMISPNTKIPNLYLTGQNLKLHGVLGVTASAVVTCSAILGRSYLMQKIIAAS
jgi:all-trans-retinol 13,14-reductase